MKKNIILILTLYIFTSCSHLDNSPSRTTDPYDGPRVYHTTTVDTGGFVPPEQTITNP